MTMSDAAPPAQYSRNYSHFNGSGSVSHSPSVDESLGETRRTPYERLSSDLSNDQRVLKEITLGKRIGFYRIRGELGSGNFSQVKMGIHALTKGKVKNSALQVMDNTEIYNRTSFPSPVFSSSLFYPNFSHVCYFVELKEDNQLFCIRLIVSR